MQDPTYAGEVLNIDKTTSLKLFKLVEIINNSRLQILLNFLLPDFK